MPAAEREFDLVLFGATGFTGGLTAEYLAGHADPGTRWALAGRSRDKLERLRERLSPINAAAGEVPLLEADVGDVGSMRRLGESAGVVISAVGPYMQFGEPLVAACAEAGTDYVDLTGEPEFVDLMWLRYNDAAQRSGARIVHSCGFDSIPFDLGALFTVERLPEGVPIALEGFSRVSMMPSGGTYHTTLQVMGRVRQAAAVARERRAREPRPAGRTVRGVVGRPHHDVDAGGWVVPLPTVDPQTVLRSARALDRYGPDFSYSHYGVVKRLPALVGLGAGAGALVALAQLAPSRNALMRVMGSGQGPSPERRAKSWFNVRFVGRADGKRVVTEVMGGDPGYTEASKMLAESALCLAHDFLPDRSGQLTPAVAMGDTLIRRLERAGIGFTAVE